MIPMRELVSHSIGGGWGEERRAEGTEQVAIIRGADFPGVAVGDTSGIPHRWESVRKLPQRTLQPGDIVLEGSGGTSDRPTGRTVFISEQLLDRFDVPVIPASFCRLVRIDPALADPHYVYWWLQGMYADGRTWGYQNRSTGIANFQFQHFLDTETVRLPSLDEQRAIAATLGALDDKIESNRRAQASGEQLLHAFVRSALATSSGNEGELSDYCVLVKKPARTSDLTGAENYIGLEHMPRSSLFLGSWGTAEDLGSNKSWFQTGDILFGKLRPYFKKVGFAPVDGVCSTDILVLRAKNAADSALVAAVAGSDELIDAVSAAATGTRMPRASWSDLAGWKLPILTADERQHLAYKTAPLIARLIALTHESLRLASLRDALLPELLSGRLRAPSEGIKA